MKSNVPWSIKGIDPDTRVAAKRAAKEAGMTLGEWLNKQIMAFEAGADDTDAAGEIAADSPAGDNVQPLPSNVVTVDQLRELVYSLNRLNERLKTSERDSRQALSGLNQGLYTAMERIREVEDTSRNGSDEAVLERLARIEADRKSGETARIDNLLNLEQALSRMVEEFETHQRDTLNRVQVSEQAIDDLAGRVSGLDAQMATTINDLKKNIDDVTSQVRQTEKTARAVMLEARAASQSTDDEFIERTGNKLRILGTEIKRSGDHIQVLEEQIGKLSGRIEGAEQRSAEGISKVSATIEALRSDLSTYDTGQAALSQEAQGVISSVTEEADARITSLQTSFDKMVARLEGVVDTDNLAVAPEPAAPAPQPADEEDLLAGSGSDDVLDELFDDARITEDEEPAPAAPDDAPAKPARKLTAKQKVLLARRARQKRLAAEASAQQAEPAAAETDEVAPPPMALEAVAEAPVMTETGAIPPDVERRLKEAREETTASDNAVNRNIDKLKAKYNKSREGLSLPIVPMLISLAVLLLAGLGWVLFRGGAETGSQLPAGAGQTDGTLITGTSPDETGTGSSPAIDTGTPAEGITAEDQFQRWKTMSARAGGAEDQARALQILKRSAARDYPPAQFALAEVYSTGEGGPANNRLARQWTQAAAEGGNVDAMHKLGSMYATGEGGAQDIFTAISWFEQAAAHGRINSIYNLALIYDPSAELEGLSGTVKDAASAYYWYALAEKLGDPDATIDANRAGQMITPEKRRELDGRAASWTAVPPIASANVR